ncbi:TIGR01777 family oxidoreductase [Microbacterium sp. Leaf159]|uniref:TIGR01777 family oxidoreductase n=1 Tax=Microbacterium sp. Leaf159 TaxID=1736279 RepID=UPI0006FAC96F|nr:TIGR01777 family oxidoreductase [Microbacterium sp. Leaf159]KQR38280.1 nucleoside-diphosphate sugar epimerase [Microbacterium sp. Leaf159]
MAQRIVISGASGLIGTALASSLRADGVEVTTLVRRTPRATSEVEWSPGERELDPDVLAGADAVVALGGASVGRLPWTRRYRRELVDSRLTTTRTLATAVRTLRDDAPAFVSASAVGYYGSAPGETLTEESLAGDTFLAQLCVRWEQEAQRAGEQSRVALLRTAPIIHRQGVLKPLIQLTRFGVAGPIGPGTQIWPWISLDDEVRGIRHVIDARLEGPVNFTGPTRASANDIGRALAKRMRRPFWIPAPAFALRLALSRSAADSLLLSDADVRPTALERSGFEFTHTTAQQAVDAAL